MPRLTRFSFTKRQTAVKTLLCTLGSIFLLSARAAGQEPQYKPLPAYYTEIAAVGGWSLGDQADAFGFGWGVQGGGTYPLDRNSRLGVIVGYTRFSLDEAKVNESWGGSAAGRSFKGSGHLQTIPVLLAYRYVVGSEGVTPYFLAEGGIYFVSSKISGSIMENGQIYANVPEEKTSSVEPGFALGSGLLFPMSPSLNLDVALRYNWVKATNRYNVDNYTGNVTQAATGQYFSLALGVVFTP